MENNIYYQTIYNFAQKNYKSDIKDISISETTRTKLVNYMNSHRKEIEQMLHNIGYNVYITCVMWDKFDEIRSYIAGEPYIYRDEEHVILKYYESLLKNPVTECKIWIGSWINVVFNCCSKTLRIDYSIHGNSKIKFNLIKAFNNNDHINLRYELLNYEV